MQWGGPKYHTKGVDQRKLRRGNILAFYIYIYICIYIYIYIYIYTSKPSTNQDGKTCQNIKPPTPTQILSSVQLNTWGTWGKLEDQAANSFYTFCYMLIVLKRFLSKTKFNCFKKMSIFSYSLLQKILKFRRSSLKLLFLIKIVYNQCLLFRNYGLWH